ncbi:hypothetical protein LLE87_38380, partial [Paenibacillus polymyxa]|nr:hypothetical protein [Paenibacillus polymyxa]
AFRLDRVERMKAAAVHSVLNNVGPHQVLHIACTQSTDRACSAKTFRMGLEGRRSFSRLRRRSFGSGLGGDNDDDGIHHC